MEAEKFVNTLKCTNDVAERGNMIIRMPASARPVCYITRGTQSPDGLSWLLDAGGGGHGGEGGHQPPLPGHQAAPGAQSVSAVSTVSSVSSEQWTASPTLETECYVVSGLCGNW